MKVKPSARHAYLEAEVVNGLAHQIRAIRMQRDWTQAQLAKRLGTTQAAVSRLEDPSYGRYTLQTLVELANAFDVGMQVRFVSFLTMLQETFRPSLASRFVHSFEEEAPQVDFYKIDHQLKGNTYGARVTSSPQDGLGYTTLDVSQTALSPISIKVNF